MPVPTKEIKLTNGMVAIVDAEDYEYLNQWTWRYGFGYAIRAEKNENGQYRSIMMHRSICEPENGLDVDHINLNRLDNRKENLRVCTRSQNIINRRVQSNNKSGYKGVFWKNSRKRWVAQLSRKELGSFKDAIEAASAYDKAALERFGEYAVTNKQLGLI